MSKGEGGNIYCAYKLNQGRRRRKDVPFHRRGGGKHTATGGRKDGPFHREGEMGNIWPQEKEGWPVPRKGGGKHISLCLYDGI